MNENKFENEISEDIIREPLNEDTGDTFDTDDILKCFLSDIGLEDDAGESNGESESLLKYEYPTEDKDPQTEETGSVIECCRESGTKDGETDVPCEAKGKEYEDTEKDQCDALISGDQPELKKSEDSQNRTEDSVESEKYIPNRDSGTSFEEISASSKTMREKAYSDNISFEKRYISTKKAGAIFTGITAAAVVLCIAAALGVMLKGPSKTLSDDIRKSGKIPFVKAANVVTEENIRTEETPVALEAASQQIPETNPVTDKYGLTDDDGDGIIFHKFTYKGSTGYMLVILDPKRVSVGTAIKDPIYLYGNGKVLDEIISDYDAIGGINAGGFIDESGAGTGWPPDGITYSGGVCFNQNPAGGVCGLDENGMMYVGYYEYSDTEALGIKEAVSFGPILIAGGEMTDKSKLERGINPRTAIGQREDGAIILMVVDGRQGYSIGVSYADCADILRDYGCVNAINMDGGNSTCMFYKGEIVNHPSNPAGGTRYLPDAWIIKGN